jgi:hypothetical protein
MDSSPLGTDYLEPYRSGYVENPWFSESKVENTKQTHPDSSLRLGASNIGGANTMNHCPFSATPPLSLTDRDAAHWRTRLTWMTRRCGGWSVEVEG